MHTHCIDFQKKIIHSTENCKIATKIPNEKAKKKYIKKALCVRKGEGRLSIYPFKKKPPNQLRTERRNTKVRKILDRYYVQKIVAGRGGREGGLSK